MPMLEHKHMQRFSKTKLKIWLYMKWNVKDFQFLQFLVQSQMDLNWIRKKTPMQVDHFCKVS